MPTSRLSEISLAAPAYREGAGLRAVVERWMEYLAARFPAGRYEVVICNDGSDDDTGEVLAALAARFPALRVVTHAVNQGAAAALTTAIAHTTRAWVLLIDSDGQFPIEDLERFEGAWAEPPPQAFIGVRLGKKDSLFSRFGSWSSGQLCNAFHRSHYRDFNSAFKLVRGDLLRSLHLEAKGLNYSTEITSRLLEHRVALVEVPVEHVPRRSGTSSVKVIKGALHRFLFVSYIGLRQLLLATGVLRRPQAAP
ncbi:MAG: glycosyltransferase family 2 protein [Myxococcales bacterium]